MKKILRTVLISVALMLGLGACDSVPSGYVGVKVEKYGDDRGVKQEVLGPGRYWTGLNTDVFEFPTFTQTDNYAGEQKISFQTKEGTTIAGDFGITFHIKKENVPLVFQTYRRGIDEISDRFLRNMVRDSLVEHAGQRSMDDLMVNKESFLKAVNDDVIKTARAKGIEVEGVTSLGGFVWPESIRLSMDAKMKATQDAMRVENEIRKTEAEAKKQVVTAQAQVAVAEAEAKATALRGEALAKNPQILQQMAIEKWDGKLPQVSGGATPFISLK